MPSSNARTRFAIDLWLVSERLSAKLDANLGAVHGIGFTEFMVLQQLARSSDGRMRRVDLAAAIGRTQSGVTRLLRPMEKTGLVERGSSDRDARVSLVALTDAGRIRLEQAVESVNHMTERFTKIVGDSQIDSAVAALALLRTD